MKGLQLQKKKFKFFADELLKKDVSVLRLDFRGLGLSDGDFSQTTLFTQKEDILNLISLLKKDFGAKKVSFICHSFGACSLAVSLGKLQLPVEKIILLSPALNQKNLQEYWFTQKMNTSEKITWENYKLHFDQSLFKKELLLDYRETKTNYLNKDFIIGCVNTNFEEFYSILKEKILHIHGFNDQVVPLKSMEIDFKNVIIIPQGDHDLEKSRFLNLWLEEAVKFITS